MNTALQAMRTLGCFRDLIKSYFPEGVIHENSSVIDFLRGFVNEDDNKPDLDPEPIYRAYITSFNTQANAPEDAIECFVRLIDLLEKWTRAPNDVRARFQGRSFRLSVFDCCDHIVKTNETFGVLTFHCNLHDSVSGCIHDLANNVEQADGARCEKCNSSDVTVLRRFFFDSFPQALCFDVIGGGGFNIEKSFQLEHSGVNLPSQMITYELRAIILFGVYSHHYRCIAVGETCDTMYDDDQVHQFVMGQAFGDPGTMIRGIVYEKSPQGRK